MAVPAVFATLGLALASLPALADDFVLTNQGKPFHYGTPKADPAPPRTYGGGLSSEEAEAEPGYRNEYFAPPGWPAMEVGSSELEGQQGPLSSSFSANGLGAPGLPADIFKHLPQGQGGIDPRLAEAYAKDPNVQKAMAAALAGSSNGELMQDDPAATAAFVQAMLAYIASRPNPGATKPLAGIGGNNGAGVAAHGVSMGGPRFSAGSVSARPAAAMRPVGASVPVGRASGCAGGVARAGGGC